MTTFEAVILGLVQGVTEFLPISSTAHLRLVPAVAGWDDPGAAYTAVLQLGTLGAVIAFFMPDLLRMVRSALRALQHRGERPDTDARHLLYLIIGTIPIGIAGILLRHAVEGAFRSLWVVANALIVVALALAWVERRGHSQGRTLDAIDLRDAVLIGCAQALALVPGVSRSGITLLAAMALGIRRDAAARFSFLLSVPAVAAAGLFELPKILKSHDLGGAPLAIGLVVAAVSGYASIAWLLKFLRTRSTMPFVIYRVMLGLLIIAMLVSGRLG
ncbi:MAG TPA: undecaprenyl-diphosphatase UppP [Polyangia bacterium]|nr:undecaprenyl-diphosphatase UppP [Polyangia bacterium]